MKNYDVIIIGAGAAGLFAARTALAEQKSVLIIEMGNAPARKVAVSGGGHCNITNTAAKFDRYFGQNPDFVRGALSRFAPEDIINWCHIHNLRLTEKTTGRYFCTNGAMAVVNALMRDISEADFLYNTKITDVKKINGQFVVNDFVAKSVIIATGGISFPTLGVSDAGYKIAKKFGHKIIPVRPALCALKIVGAQSEIAGVSLDAEIKIGKTVLRDSLLLTHFGLGGPLAYRASLCDLSNGFWLNLMPDIDVEQLLKNKKKTAGKKNIANVLYEYLPNRLVKKIVSNSTKNIADIPDKEIEKIAARISNVFISADKISLHGMSAAEVVRGGVDTNEVSSKTMESKLCAGLFFVGEVLDIAGDLGGFNLQWAWSSGYVAGICA